MCAEDICDEELPLDNEMIKDGAENRPIGDDGFVGVDGKVDVKRRLSRVGMMGCISPRRSELKRMVDIVFVIDAAGSMGSLIEEVKRRVLVMHKEFISGLSSRRIKVTKMRVRAVVFRDLYADAEPFEESRFFTLPDEGREFCSFIENIRVTGGGGKARSSLEALCMAMQSDFQESERDQKARRIIVLFTDAPAHPLDHPQRNTHSGYPQGIPTSLAGVEELWEGMDVYTKRMVVFAPYVWPWSELALWMLVDYTPCAAGSGIDAETFSSVIQYIAGNV